MVKFFICYVAGSDGGRHYRHWSKQSAMAEAERLAKGNQGRRVYILECVGGCWVDPQILWIFPLSGVQEFPEDDSVNQREKNIRSHSD